MDRFHTVELSDPGLEGGPLRFLTVKSRSLGRRADLCVYVPPGAHAGPLPLVTLLHGVYGSHWAWALKGAAHLTAGRLIESGAIRPMVLAMPSDGLWGDGSGYLRHADADHAAWIVDEVPAAAAEAAPVGPDSPRFLAGLSMGGYGALRLGAAFAERFAGLSGHSSITRFEQLTEFVEEPLEAYEVLDDARDVIDAMRRAPRLPPLRFDCGTEDSLIEANRALHRQLGESEIDHVYEEFAGGHTWEYWTEHLEETLRFFEGILAG